MRWHGWSGIRIIDRRVRHIGEPILGRRRCRMRMLYGHEVGTCSAHHVLRRRSRNHMRRLRSTVSRLEHAVGHGW